MMTPNSKHEWPSDMATVINTKFWLMVLASPPLYRTMKRVADPGHLVRLMDVWIAYAERGDHYHGVDFPPEAHEQRAPLARRLRALLAGWTPPELPAEITDVTRALLDAEGIKPPRSGSWDATGIDDEYPLEDILVWPEGIPALLRRNAAQGSDDGGERSA